MEGEELGLEDVMATKQEIVEQIHAIQRSMAKVSAYTDIIDLIGKYEGTLQRKLNDANKKKERIGQRDHKSQAYLDIVASASILQAQLLETHNLRIDLMEKLVELKEENLRIGNSAKEFVGKLDV